MALQRRTLRPEEQATSAKLAHSRTASVRLVERARIRLLACQGHRVPAMAPPLQRTALTVRTWCQRFHTAGLAGLADQPGAGRPAPSAPHAVAAGLATALTPPAPRG